MGPRHVPPSPPGFEGRLVPGGSRVELRDGIAQAVREGGAHDQAGRHLGDSGFMAEKTRVALALKAGQGIGLLQQAVEARAPEGVHGGHLHDGAALDPPDVHVIVEVESPGSPWSDAVRLEARAGEHQGLGRRPDVQCVQQVRQIPPEGVVLHPHAPLVDPGLQHLDRIHGQGFEGSTGRWTGEAGGAEHREHCAQRPHRDHDGPHGGHPMGSVGRHRRVGGVGFGESRPGPSPRVCLAARRLQV